MMKNQPPQKEISEQLQKAIERLQEDVHRIEIWAGALSGFAQDIPKYEPSSDRYLLNPPASRFGEEER